MITERDSILFKAERYAVTEYCSSSVCQYNPPKTSIDNNCKICTLYRKRLYNRRDSDTETNYNVLQQWLSDNRTIDGDPILIPDPE